MNVISLHDRGEIERHLRRNPNLHFYSLGDLDDLFWPQTIWYADVSGGQASEIVMLYTALALPVMQALTDTPGEPMRELLRSTLPLMPRRMYAHLSLGLSDTLATDYSIDRHGTYYKMALADMTKLDSIDTSRVVPLTYADASELQALYDAAYPGNSFAPHMLGIGHYYGIRHGGQLVSAAGLHVYSSQYRVAAVANVATHPLWQGQGLARAVCAHLCRALLPTADHIGLNVKESNQAALACYEALGFQRIAPYEECTLTLKPEALGLAEGKR
jgi:GNAT superfamily N-acetyltransferase